MVDNNEQCLFFFLQLFYYDVVQFICFLLLYYICYYITCYEGQNLDDADSCDRRSRFIP